MSSWLGGMDDRLDSAVFLRYLRAHVPPACAVCEQGNPHESFFERRCESFVDAQKRTLMPIRKASPAISLLAASMLRVAAAEVTNLPELGAHHPILVVGKNVNPQNLMVIYTKVDAKGRFLANSADQDRPVFDFYWLMDGKDYKPVNGLIKNEIRRRFECQLSPGDRATHFVINVNDLKEVNSDIKEPKVDVYATGSGDAQDVEAQITLGPSDGNMRIRLSSIYTEGRAFPPAVYSVTLKGEKIVNGKLTGKKVARKYEAKK